VEEYACDFIYELSEEMRRKEREKER